MQISGKTSSNNTAFAGLALVLLAACGGGKGGSTIAPTVPPPVQHSPGGVWFLASADPANSMSMYITETGELMASFRPNGDIIPSFGSGQVSVTESTRIDGSFEMRNAPVGTFPQLENLGCSLSGTVSQRSSMNVDITCSDSSGIVYDKSVTLMYDDNMYERPSSLADLAGVYTLNFQRATNILSIAGDGSLNGEFDNGARCLINGTAENIDPNYSLLRITWTMSACTNVIGNYEGVEMSGIAMRNPPGFVPAGSYYFLLTGNTPDGLYAISVMYEPA